MSGFRRIAASHVPDETHGKQVFAEKCVACHGPKADKKFDPALSDEQCIDAILKGKKPEKPPNMPAYGEKGVTQEQAKALLDHMKQLRSAQ